MAPSTLLTIHYLGQAAERGHVDAQTQVAHFAVHRAILTMCEQPIAEEIIEYLPNGAFASEELENPQEE